MATYDITANTSGSGPLVWLEPDQSLYVAPGITIHATSGNAIVAEGSGSNSDIQGAVIADDNDSFRGIGPGHRIEEGVTGSIQADGTGIEIEGSDAHIVNRGSIVGYSAILIDGGNVWIENTGTIRSTKASDVNSNSRPRL